MKARRPVAYRSDVALFQFQFVDLIDDRSGSFLTSRSMSPTGTNTPRTGSARCYTEA
jgi:hypothetical protein